MGENGVDIHRTGQGRSNNIGSSLSRPADGTQAQAYMYKYISGLSELRQVKMGLFVICECTPPRNRLRQTLIFLIITVL